MLARSLSLTAASLAVLATAAIASPARAADVDTKSTTVGYHDLDLTSAAGEAALKQRIATAAKNDCGSADGRTTQDYDRLAACRNSAIASASPQMNAVIASARSNPHIAIEPLAMAMSGR